jgi:hypothetical protein
MVLMVESFVGRASPAAWKFRREKGQRRGVAARVWVRRVGTLAPLYIERWPARAAS